MDVKQSAISVAPAAALAAEQSAATPESDENRRPILKRIIQCTQAVTPPALWGRFGSSWFVRRFSCEPKELLARLSEHFTADQLLAARVAVQTQSAELEISKPIAT